MKIIKEILKESLCALIALFITDLIFAIFPLCKDNIFLPFSKWTTDTVKSIISISIIFGFYGWYFKKNKY
ncbi:MAG: hypothetical protein K0R54_247 [Clostridiaceae bacterium]|jgi:H+/Cl- antiporter ClcA|nr:hypothetical protein [Clostridiaceae bacterium]